MIDGDGNPITMRELEDTILRTLKSNGELDISDLRYLLAQDEGICADEDEVTTALRVLATEGRARYQEEDEE